MVRIIRVIVIGQVATDACRGQAVILTAGVTLIAAGLNVLTCQREARVVMVKHGLPVRGCMACLALIAKPSRFMVRLVGIIIVGKMATHARCGQTVVLPTRVTLVATGLDVLTC